MVGLDQGVKSESTTQAPGIPPLAPHASLGIDDAQAASLLVVLKSISADLAYTSGDLSSDEGFGRLEGPKCFKYSSTSVQP